VSLDPKHREVLRAVVNDTTIEEMGARSLERAEFAALSPLLSDAESVLEFPYPGIEGFSRYRRFPQLNGCKYWQQPKKDPTENGVHLYVLPSVRKVLRDPTVTLTIVEGEKKAACLTQFGFPAIGIGGVWSWANGAGDLHPEFDHVWFVDRRIVICFDSNAWRKDKEDIGRSLYALGKAIESRGSKVEAIIVPPDSEGNDWGADDFIAANGIESFKELKRITISHPALSQHKTWWENWIKGKTKEEKEIGKLASRLQPIEPWPDQVDGIALLDEISATFQRFVVTVQPEAVIIASLWAVFTHALDAFGIAPFLVFWSPLPECGKTVAQSIVGRLVPKPLEGSSLTQAVVFRTIEKFQPTLLVDEAADLLDNPELMSLFRASHQRNKAFTFRCDPDTHEPRDYSTWCAKSLCITEKRIERAFASRSLIIEMHRKKLSEKREGFSDLNEYPEIEALRRQVSRWVQDNLSAIREAVVDSPQVKNRNLDNFVPLFKIAQVVGGRWPKLVNDAALKFVGVDAPIDQSLSVELLKDIRQIFDDGVFELDNDGSKKIASAALVDKLVSSEERPWATYNKGKPISQNQVGRLLKGFPIYSRYVWIGNKTLKGYIESQFKDAFERYLPPDTPPDPPETPPPPSPTDSEPQGHKAPLEINNLGQKTQPQGNDVLTVGKSGLSTENYKRPCGLTVGELVSRASAPLPASEEGHVLCRSCHIPMNEHGLLFGGTDLLCQSCGQRQPLETPPPHSPTDSEQEGRNSTLKNNNLGQKTQQEGGGALPVAKSELSIENYKQSSGHPVGEPVLRASVPLPDTLPASLDRFAKVYVLDFEFYCPEGANPEPHCVVAHEIRNGASIQILRDGFTTTPPFEIGPDSLTLIYSGASDLRCFMAAGWPLSENYIDLAVEAKLQSNSPGPDRGLPSLIESLDRFGIPHIDHAEKKKSQKRYGKPSLDEEDRRDILPYCASDVYPLPELFLRLLPDIDIDKALERGAYVKETAIIEQRGIPISVKEYEKISANRKQIRLDLIAQSPIGLELYVKGAFSFKKLGAWLDKNGIEGWEQTEKSGRFRTDEDYLKKVAAIEPAVQPILDLFLALKDFKKCPFGVGLDGRAHADQIPFGTITGRNAPSSYILTAAKWWRWAIKAPEGFALIYLDYVAMEYAIAAFLSGDENMIATYLDGDIHSGVAKQLGIDRKSAKTLNFAMQYGGGSRGLSESLGIPLSEAQEIYGQHKSTYQRYWQWSDDSLAELKSKGFITLPGDGWGLRFDASNNGIGELSARNFPVQALGAAILRRVVIETSKEDIEAVGPLHDALLVQARVSEVEKISRKTSKIMRNVSKQLLGQEIRVSVSEPYRGRFEDEDGAKDWKRITKIMKKYK
jgi:DNA polymerase I